MLFISEHQSPLVIISWQILSQRLAGKLLAVFLVALPVIGIGGALYKFSSGLSWRQSIFKAYNAMSDVPGKYLNGSYFFRGCSHRAIPLGSHTRTSKYLILCHWTQFVALYKV